MMIWRCFWRGGDVLTQSGCSPVRETHKQCNDGEEEEDEDKNYDHDEEDEEEDDDHDVDGKD